MSMIGQLASGMLATCEIFVLTLVFSLPLGLLVAFGRMSKNKAGAAYHQDSIFPSCAVHR